MRTVIVLLGGIVAALASQAIAAWPRDIFLRDGAVGGKASLSRLSTDLLLGHEGASDRLEQALAANKGTSEERLEAYLLLCGAHFREQRYDRGLKACLAAEAIEKKSAGNMVDLHRALNRVGPARWSADVVRLSLTEAQSATLVLNGQKVRALFDTGAEIGVASSRVAKLFEARALEAAFEVGTTTKPIEGGLAVIPKIDFGGAVLSDLTVFVLPDEQAQIAEIDLIVPLSAMVLFDRMAYADHGATLLLGNAAPPLRSDRTPLYWDESGVGFAVDFAGGRRGVHLDTGSKRTWLFPAALPALSAAERATSRLHQRKIAGIGGERIENAAMLHRVTLSIAGQDWLMPEIEVAEKDENGEAARIGTGLFERFRTVVIDFRRMQMGVADD